jgi:uncharacterized phage protein (TIGR01671 family)
MREILFRGKEGNGSWIFGDLIQISGCLIRGKNKLASVYDRTVCQFTGLHDKEKNRIFEHDIMEFQYDEKYPEEKTVLEIFWDEANVQYGMRDKAHNINDKLEQWDCLRGKVIGNIFDNPELLE